MINELNEIPAPSLPEETPISASLIACDRIYKTDRGLWMLAGTFNQMENQADWGKTQGSVFILPPIGVFWKIQYDKKKTYRMLLVERLIKINQTNVNFAQVVGTSEFELNAKNYFSTDGGAQLGETQFNDGGQFLNKRDDNVMFRIESWISNRLIAYSTIHFHITAFKPEVRS